MQKRDERMQRAHGLLHGLRAEATGCPVPRCNQCEPDVGLHFQHTPHCVLSLHDTWRTRAEGLAAVSAGCVLAKESTQLWQRRVTDGGRLCMPPDTSTTSHRNTCEDHAGADHARSDHAGADHAGADHAGAHPNLLFYI
eukprot:100813-Chlamydomonas_euryale.AAC.7